MSRRLLALWIVSAGFWGTSAGGAQQPSLQPLPAVPAAPSAAPELGEARRLMQAGHLPEAEALLRGAVRADPRSPEANEQLAYCLLREDKPKEALEQYTRAAALRTPDAAELVNVGQAYALLGDLDDADRWLLRAVRMGPENSDGWYNLGRVRYTEQRFGDAVSCFERALQLSPQNAKAENNLGLADEGLNKLDEAVRAYRQAIAWEGDATGPGTEQPFLNLAIVLLHRGELDEARRLLTRAAEISPNDPRIFEQEGHLGLQQNDPKAAAEAFTKAVALDPKNSSLHFLLGQAYRRLGDAKQAEVEFAEAERLRGKPGGGRP